jgi:hypothetical protein
MRRAYWYAGAGLALAAITLTPVQGSAAENPVPPNSNAITTPSGIVTNPGEQTAPGVSMSTADKANFVSQKIADAKAQAKT